LRKLIIDLESSSPVIFGQTLWNRVLLSKIPSFDPKYSFQNFEKLMTDLDSASPIAFDQNTCFIDPKNGP
jgi:hypothetical protein